MLGKEVSKTTKGSFNMDSSNKPIKNESGALLQQTKSVVFFEACLFMVLGLFAIAVPLVFGLAVDLAIGFVLIAGGVTQLYRTFQGWGVSGTWGALLLSITSTIAGGILIFQPLVGLVALTTIVAAYFFVEACAKIYWAMSSSMQHRGWLFFSGLLSLLLSGIIIAGLPQTAVWVIGILIGVDCLCFALFLFMLSSSLETKKGV